MEKLSITWFGHATFLLRTPGGKRVLLDPWFTSNPSCPDAMKKPPKADLILASHGHFDHIEDLLLCARDSGAPVVGIKEAEIVEADLTSNRMAEVTVRFVSELVNATRDKAGQLVGGNPNAVEETIDIWTFARNLRSSDPNWQLIATATPA